jgi:hypothetical protein
MMASLAKYRKETQRRSIVYKKEKGVAKERIGVEKSGRLFVKLRFPRGQTSPLTRKLEPGRRVAGGESGPRTQKVRT